MILLLKLIYESIVQAFTQLRSNKLRSFLSLLGITIGIFCIISVKSAVDSLEFSIKDIFSTLGSNVIYVDIFPWDQDPQENYWKYLKRPLPSAKEAEIIAQRSELTKLSAFLVAVSRKTIKNGSSSVSSIDVTGVTFDYGEMMDLNLEEGRWFTRLEDKRGSNKIVLGHQIAEELFPKESAINKSVKLMGLKFNVVGVIEKEGDNLFNATQYDEGVLIPYSAAKKFINVKENSRIRKIAMVSSKPGVSLDELKDEVTGILRAFRRVRPTQDDSFSLNDISTINNVLDEVFSKMNLAGLIIGIFALIVGMFSVANIMFVSVNERTNIIGIKKALGAKRGIILLEFLIESIILCIIGGLIGLLFVFLVVKAISALSSFQMFLSFENMSLGVSAAICVGIISGIIPAFLASRLDPVVAIRK